MILSVDERYRLLAAGYIRKQVRRLARQLDGCRIGEDIECVHQARVASRRLRAALSMFGDCFPRKRFKRWRKAVRGITNGLGEARDLDVQIDFLCETLNGLDNKDAYPGIARLMVHLEKQRERVQPNVTAAVKRFEATGVLGDIRRTTKRIIKEASRRGLNVQSEAVYLQTERHILDRLNEVMRYQESLDDPELFEQHHAMRIATKRLRYTVEISKPVYQKQLDPSITAVKEIQTLLGDIHDCDVWLERLEAFAKQERGRIRKRFRSTVPFARLRIGIDHLAAECAARREATFQRLVDYWHELEQAGAWESLVTAVGIPPNTPPDDAPSTDTNGNGTGEEEAPRVGADPLSAAPQ